MPPKRRRVKPRQGSLALRLGFLATATAPVVFSVLSTLSVTGLYGVAAQAGGREAGLPRPVGKLRRSAKEPADDGGACAERALALPVNGEADAAGAAGMNINRQVEF